MPAGTAGRISSLLVKPVSAVCNIGAYCFYLDQTRYEFAAKKTIPHAECYVCEYASICHGGCPKLRQGPNKRFEDLDYFCSAYKMIFAKSVAPLRTEVLKNRS
jgi:radical SAM protein with 4Fe4S-binding SPASM domain